MGKTLLREKTGRVQFYTQEVIAAKSAMIFLESPCPYRKLNATGRFALHAPLNSHRFGSTGSKQRLAPSNCLTLASKAAA
jgi:hypothetical protein